MTSVFQALNPLSWGRKEDYKLFTLDLTHLLSSKRVLVCVGSGGVGKTTTAAALALRAATIGRKTLVLTIDPAKRLANSLGVESLSHDMQEIPQENLAANGVVFKKGGSLHAMMLDQKRAFDELVARHASDGNAVKRILANPVYNQISGTLSGSQEYAAMATVHEIDAKGDFDLIVVDTPPTSHALDFLEAPEKLSQALDSPAVDWFRKLYGRGDSGWSVVGRTGSYVLRRLAKFVGEQFIDDLSVFFTEFNDILGGFRKRAEETYSLLRQDRVGFILVTSPETMALREASSFFDRLALAKMPFGGLVINRAHQNIAVDSQESITNMLSSELPKQIADLTTDQRKLGIETCVAAYDKIQTCALADEAATAPLSAKVKPAPIVKVPIFKEDIHDLKRLGQVGSLLAP